jgi:hypothetical protein
VQRRRGVTAQRQERPGEILMNSVEIEINAKYVFDKRESKSGNGYIYIIVSVERRDGVASSLRSSQ